MSKPQGSLGERTQAASAFMKAVDELNAASTKCYEAGLFVRCSYVEDRCQPHPVWVAVIETKVSKAN